MGSSEITWDQLGLGSSEIILPGIIWNHLGPSGIIWDHLGSSGIIWDHLGSSGIIWVWDHLGSSSSSGIIWDNLGSSGVIWGHLGSSGALEGFWKQFCVRRFRVSSIQGSRDGSRTIFHRSNPNLVTSMSCQARMERHYRPALYICSGSRFSIGRNSQLRKVR